ncbi:MAG: hypothetical protein DYG98_01930 [Haliscomenobacteraceae bacterium CHB4]|nr:hypothetical protein [Saprospiraceae bacterium]MCE7921790.1 hypothetical protein [Haliscomenobacteraceae bacterium CHB4]
MRLKAFYFLLPLVAAAIIFTFCTKESSVVSSEISQTEQTIGSEAAGDREGRECLVTVTVNYGGVIICGTNTDLSQCGTGSCYNNSLYGSQFLAAPASATYTVYTPGSIIITDDNGAELSNVTVTTSAGSITTGVGVGAGAKEFCVNDKCGLSMIR